MKEFRFRIILILGAIGLCLYLLYPTYVDARNEAKINKFLAQRETELKSANPTWTIEQVNKKLRFVEDSIKAADPSINQVKQKRVKLGLDLQGGMRVVLEVNTGELLGKIAKEPDDTFKRVLAESEKEANLSDESVVDILARKMQARGIRLSRYFGNIREDDSSID